MSIELHIQKTFEDSIATKQQAMKQLIKPIATAGQMMVDCLLNNRKILICGNGGSAADAQHFSAELLNRYQIDRPPLPAIALTTDTSTLTSIGNDYDFNLIFSKQVKALGQAGDVLLAISTSGDSPNILKAIEAAEQKGLTVIALTGKTGGAMKAQLDPERHGVICVPGDRTARIQETHLLIIHCLCDMIEQHLFSTE